MTRFVPILIVLSASLLGGCKDNPGKWKASEVEAFMEEETKMKINVTEEEDGSLTANGVDRREREYTFLIEQDPERREIKWTSFDSEGKQLKIHTSRVP